MPALLVHGIWDTGKSFARMRTALDTAGLGPTHAVDLAPNDGRATIATLASQVEAAARQLARETGNSRIDVIGFSMGALGSALLTDLARDSDPWGDVEVHCFWTPFDLMILPARSAVLRGARTVQKFRVPMHRWMITDRRVIGAVCDVLRASDVPSDPR